jgi:hypothetical protein
MKNRYFVSGITILFGVLLLLIPTVLFPVCSSEEMKMACYYTARTELGLGFFVVLMGAVSLFTANAGVRIGCGLAQAGAGILVLLYPAKLTGLCKMGEMLCRMRTFPALIVTGVLLIVLSIGNAVYLIRKDRKDYGKAN